MYSFISQLLDTSDFMPRWHCGNWTPAHGYLHIFSDLGVWSAYLAIPLVLGFFLLRKRDLPFRSIFVLFGAFIFACGTTHLMDAIIFWWPAYRLSGVIKLATAAVSWATVIALVPITPKALAMRSSCACASGAASPHAATAAKTKRHDIGNTPTPVPFQYWRKASEPATLANNVLINRS